MWGPGRRQWITYIVFGITLVCVPRLQTERPLFLIMSATLLFNAVGLDWLYRGLHSIEIEKLIIAYGTFENNQKCFLGWNIRSKSKKYNGHFILSYGTVLMFFILSPICDFFIAYELNDSKWFINYFNMKLLNFFCDAMIYRKHIKCQQWYLGLSIPGIWQEI